MAKTAQDVLNLIKENDIKMVDFKMVDINGQFRHVTIPAQSFNEDIMKEVPRKQKDTLFSKDGLIILVFYSLLIFVLTIFSFLLTPFNTIS